LLRRDCLFGQRQEVRAIATDDESPFGLDVAENIVVPGGDGQRMPQRQDIVAQCFSK